MTGPAEVSSAIAPWLGAADELEIWYREKRGSMFGLAAATRIEIALQHIREALRALARGEVGIPAETLGVSAGDCAQGGIDLGWYGKRRRDTRPAGFNDIRLKRDAMLRLGVWRVLRALQKHAMATGREAHALSDLQGWIASAVVDVPAGIGPALPYASSPSALKFFNDHLRAALTRLAGDAQTTGTGLRALAQSEPFEDTGVGVHRWSRAWTVAIAAVYLDWIRHRCGGNLDGAMRDLWGMDSDTVRFKAPAGLAVLPTRERSMHIDLWTSFVTAQVLSHDPARGQGNAADRPWHRLRMAMHDLGERDKPDENTGGVRTVYRGLGVEMIYQAVFMDCANGLLQLQRDHEPAMNSHLQTPAVQTIMVDLDAPCTIGQQPNLQLVLRWKNPSMPAAGRRLDLASARPDLTRLQRQALEDWGWQRAHSHSTAMPLDPVLLDWCPANEGDRFVDPSGAELAALGHAALWGTVGRRVDWIDLSLRLHLNGHWSNVPLIIQEHASGGELRSWLLLAPAEFGEAALPVDAVRKALRSTTNCLWAATPAGVGAFIMLAIDLDRRD